MSGPELESGVRKRMQDPDGEMVNLLVKLSDTSERVLEEIEQSAENTVVEEELPLRYLAVEASDADIESLKRVEEVTKIEIEGSGKMMSSDFRYRPESAL